MSVFLRVSALATALILTAACAAAQPGSRVSGSRALQHVRVLVEPGPRVAGSAAHAKAVSYIERTLRSYGIKVERQSFTASTPSGPLEMTNLIAEIPGATGDIVVLASHYDTKRMKGFVGANDGGSSTGLLLELARVLARRENRVALRLVFFDGEEAFEQFSATDGFYGSRHLAAEWQRDGTLARIRAFILLDMVGDRNLNFQKDFNSTRWLRDLVWEAAESLGHGAHFTDEVTAMDDDHVPFTQAGVPAVDLIDFDYGPRNRYWHSREDTLDKLSARSLRIVGEVVLESLRRLEQRPAGR